MLMLYQKSKEKNNDKSIKKLKFKVTPLIAMILDLDILRIQRKETGRW